MALCLFKASGAVDGRWCGAGVVRLAVLRTVNVRHQTALRGRVGAPSGAPTVTEPGGSRRSARHASETSPYRRPVTQNDELDPRRVTAGVGPAWWESRPTHAFGMAWPPAASASVSLHSVVGPQPSSDRCPIGATIVGWPLYNSMLDSFGGAREFSGRRPGGQSKPNGVGRVPQRDGSGSKPHKKSRTTRSS